MAKQRHWHELARGLGVAGGPANLLLHPPLVRSLSLPSLTTPLSKKEGTPTPLHPGYSKRNVLLPITVRCSRL